MIISSIWICHHFSAAVFPTISRISQKLKKIQPSGPVCHSLSQDLRDLLNAVHHSLAFVLALIITFMIKIRFIFFKIMSRFSQNTLLLVRFLFLFLFFYLFGCAVLILLRYMLGCMWTAARRTKLGRFHFLLCSFLQL